MADSHINLEHYSLSCVCELWFILWFYCTCFQLELEPRERFVVYDGDLVGWTTEADMLPLSYAYDSTHPTFIYKFEATGVPVVGGAYTFAAPPMYAKFSVGVDVIHLSGKMTDIFKLYYVRFHNIIISSWSANYQPPKPLPADTAA